MPGRFASVGLAGLRDTHAALNAVRAYLDDRLAFFAGLLDETGAAVPCRLVGGGYLLNSPEDIRHVLVRNPSGYVKSRRLAGPAAAYPTQNVLLTSRDLKHRRRRQLMQRAFRPFVEIVAERTRVNAERLARSLHDGGAVDLTEAMTALVQRSLFEALAASATSETHDRLAAAVRERADAFDSHFVSLLPLPSFVPSAANRRLIRATRELRSAIAREVADRRASAERPDDLLSLLMEASDEDGARLDDHDVREEAISIALTGYDSVTQALQWTLYLLARNRDADEKVAAEARAATSAETSRPYALSVIRESLRLFPPTWIFVRIAGADDRLPSGTTISRGAKLYLCPYVVHRNPHLWPEPERFRPHRFGPDARNGRPRYAYFPFGGGPHVCIGEVLAVTQIAIVLASVVPRRRLTLPSAQTVVPYAGLSLRPSAAVMMHAQARA